MQIETAGLAGYAVLLSVLCLYSVVRSRGRNRSEGTGRRRPRLRRPPDNAGQRAFLWQLLLITLLSLAFGAGDWSLSSVGLDTPLAPHWGLLIGVAAYFTFEVLLGLAFRWTGRLERAENNNIRTLAQLWPRDPSQKVAAAIAYCIFNPITEELIYRGILVYQVSLYLAPWPLAVAIGFAASLANHAYQGWFALTTHVPMYGIVVLMLFSPVGLWGVIGFHIAGDVYPFATMKRAARAYRKRHRRQRANPAAASPRRMEGQDRHG